MTDSPKVIDGLHALSASSIRSSRQLHAWHKGHYLFTTSNPNPPSRADGQFALAESPGFLGERPTLSIRYLILPRI